MTNYNFSIIKNPEGTYHIECLFVVYRELFGEHPSWINCPGDARDGSHALAAHPRPHHHAGHARLS